MGKTIEFEKLKVFCDIKTGKYGYMKLDRVDCDSTGTLIPYYDFDYSRCVYDEAYDFNKGIATAVLNGKTVYINELGQILGDQYGVYKAYKDGLCITLDENGNIISTENKGKTKLKK